MSITPVSGGTYFGSASASSATITGLALPVGRVLILIGASRDEIDRSLSSVTHPALSNIVTQGNTRAYNSSVSRSAEVWLVTADSDGSTGDLTVTWSDTVWSQVVRVLDVSAVGDLLTIGWSTLETKQPSFTVTASDSAAKHGVVFAKCRVSSNSATVDVSPWSTDKLEQGGGTIYRGISATADGTTGEQQTVSVSTGDIVVAVAAELLFAGVPTIDAALAAQPATVDAELVTHLIDAALQAGSATAAADIDVLLALQAALAAQAGSASGAIDHVKGVSATLAADPATIAASLGSALGLQAAMSAGRAEAAADILSTDIPVWPTALPDPQRRSFAGRRQRGSWRFEPEVGAPVEVLGAWRLHEIDCEFLLDDAQLSTWRQFFDADLQSGARAFRGREPWARSAWIYLLAAPPDLIRQANGVHRLRLRLVGMPT